MANELQHYGVKGMRWGVIRKKDGSSGSNRRNPKAQSELSVNKRLRAAKKAQRLKWKKCFYENEQKFLKELEEIEKKQMSEFEKEHANSGFIKKALAKGKLERKMVDVWSAGLERSYQQIKAERKAEKRKLRDKEYDAQEKTIAKFNKVAIKRHAEVKKKNLSFLESLKEHSKVDNEVVEAIWRELAENEIKYAR